MPTVTGYDVREMIHESATTQVFRARREADGAPVVIKVPAADSTVVRRNARLRYEHDLLRALAEVHGVARVVALEEHAGRFALVLADTRATALRHELAAGPVS